MSDARVRQDRRAVITTNTFTNPIPMMTWQANNDRCNPLRDISTRLFTRDGCHLCDHADHLLREFGLHPEPVDIEQDATLTRLYGECIPVVEINGRVRFRGRISPVMLQRVIAQATRHPSDGGHVLGVFAKYWEPNRVKTRLARTIGPTAAAKLYKQFLVAQLAEWKGLVDFPTVVFAPEERRSDFAKLITEPLLSGGNWQLEPQSGGDLGQRLESFFERAFRRDGTRKVIVAGSDTPHLPRRVILAALRELQRHDCVIGPTLDGGYYLLGLRRPLPQLFREIDWSSPHVFEQTVAQIRSLRPSVGVACLGHSFDVDQADDLPRLAESLRREPTTCRDVLLEMIEPLLSAASRHKMPPDRPPRE